ncbi:GNAT family N-acetyltransferase [Tolypothrix campylonemoides VB511288]|nr:GNAT family N-acetyltransferase [Tolypothrix campylonemoides VB511288]
MKTVDILLETERLILRRLTDADAETVYAIKLEMTELNHPLTLDNIRNRWLPNILAYYKQGYGFGYWAAIEKATSEFIGWFYFRSAPDELTDTAIGYFLRRSVWSKGYATEGARALIRKGFTKWQVS